MSLAILGIHLNEIFKLESDNLLIINKGRWDIYWTLAKEDLKLEYIEKHIYILLDLSYLNSSIILLSMN